MAAKAEVRVGVKLTGLGRIEEFAEKFNTTNTPARKMRNYVVQAVADTAEVLDVGDVGTVELIAINCVANDVDIDTSYNSAFNAELTVQEGEWAIFKPAGTLWFKNNDAGEQSTLEYIVIGT
jgi:hypothetical protein